MLHRAQPSSSKKEKLKPSIPGMSLSLRTSDSHPNYYSYEWTFVSISEFLPVSPPVSPYNPDTAQLSFLYFLSNVKVRHLSLKFSVSAVYHCYVSLKYHFPQNSKFWSSGLSRETLLFLKLTSSKQKLSQPTHFCFLFLCFLIDAFFHLQSVDETVNLINKIIFEIPSHLSQNVCLPF